jgi:beta-lactam-binding protein with PASTA domain
MSAGVAAVCVALAAAIWLTRVVTAPLPAPLVAVPDLSGMSLGQVTAALQADQLTVGAITPAASNQANKDKAVDRRPSGHTPRT